MKIAVGVSGGVDSSVALFLLKNAGHEVVAFHMQCYDYHDEICTGEQDKADAAQICSQLNVPFKFLDFQKEYQDKVIANFYSEYENGRTPNPDILCNREIKFGLFFDYATAHGFDAVATGHYAKVLNGGLYIPKDTAKDQTYFLYRIDREKLPKVIFPLADLLKSEVREIAIQNNFKMAKKAESMGICFIGEVSIKDFLKKRIPEKKGNVIDLQGNIVGSHVGVSFYTIGQRHGFELNKYYGYPMYIVAKHAVDNTLVIGTEEEAKISSFIVSEINYLADNLINEPNVRVRIRHLGELIPAELKLEKAGVQVSLDRKTFGIAPGQSCVFYSENDQVLAGGIIEHLI